RLRADGIEPLALAIYLAGIGGGAGSDHALPKSQDELAAHFDIGRFGRGAPRFDPASLTSINARLLHEMDYAALADRLGALGCDETLWRAIRGNVVRVDEAVSWVEVARGEIDPVREDPAFLAEAASMLPPEPWDADTWRRWTGAIASATGRKGRALFH